jgi:7,8-dihydropterin-6-yl-methyl-4-(beta-D-ribofuranosyl)aminobenzene 5'-phosphate synthase
VIHNPVFFIDIAEQALAINVKDKGIIVISGCGHQSMKKILERSDLLFDQPVYAVLGGFHYPVEEGRNIGWIYKYVVVDKLPWERLTVEDVNDNIALLMAKDVQLAGLSGHDSCDKSIAAFKKAFGDNYVDIKVGQKIIISN